MNKDNLIVCKRCGSDACYTQKVGKITLYSCYGCGFQTSTIMKRGEKFFEEQMDILPDLYKALLGEDEDGLIWMPQTVNLPQNGMVFATAAKEFGVKDEAVSQDNYEWACLLYTSPSPRDRQKSRMPSSA